MFVQNASHPRAVPGESGPEPPDAHTFSMSILEEGFWTPKIVVYP